MFYVLNSEINRVYQIFILILGESSEKNILGSFLATFRASNMFGAAGSLARIGLSLKPNHYANLRLAFPLVKGHRRIFK